MKRAQDIRKQMLGLMDRYVIRVFVPCSGHIYSLGEKQVKSFDGLWNKRTWLIDIQS